MNSKYAVSALLICGVAVALAQQTTSTSTSQSQNGSASASSSARGSASSSGSQQGGSGSSTSAGFRAKPTHAVLWLPGDQWVEGKSTQEQPLFKEHMDYLLLLLRAGKNIMSGPWRDEPGGLTLLRANSDLEADQLIENDPMVKAGILNAEVKAWNVIMDASGTATIRSGS